MNHELSGESCIIFTAELYHRAIFEAIATELDLDVDRLRLCRIDGTEFARFPVSDKKILRAMALTYFEEGEASECASMPPLVSSSEDGDS